MDIRKAPDPGALARQAAAYIAARITAVLNQRELCHLALAGGNTPGATYALLHDMALPWSRLHFWFGDERCLPSGDAQRNDTMVKAVLLAGLPLSASQLHNIAAELGPEAAARQYSQALSHIERLDIVLLGLGEDGHTASLFPDNPALAMQTRAVAVHHAPKPPSQRVSLSMKSIRDAGERVVIAAGEDKREALARILAGEKLPAAMVGSAIWFVDEAAIAGLCSDAVIQERPENG
ncbi:6-phosphogluconolactonase [Mariprofundus sp. KV]|uniref:6-phosphogluconolactonase n=1 Tax=Mariprofundus sp. KV TaxID=2608715 RepID=UPI0015A0B291|nr:6-phosphogluconolactonase [Mariprofundus sp. KV]NWF36373.1 6-phosphogluconolactonase [Mariprofundus sp. KV]